MSELVDNGKKENENNGLDVSEEMISAGLEAYEQYVTGGGFDLEKMIKNVFLQMSNVLPPHTY